MQTNERLNAFAKHAHRVSKTTLGSAASLGSALLWAFLTFLGVFAGLWFSLYADPVKDALPYPLDFLAEYKETFEELWFGWSLLFAFFALAVVLQVARTVLNKRARLNLQTQTDELRNAVESLRSLPPEGYLQQYHEIVGTSLSGYFEVGLSESVSREELELAIRKVLTCICKLAKSYASSEGNSQASSASANIMVALTPSRLKALPAEELKATIKNMQFCSKEARLHPEQHRLVLQLCPSLSSTSESADGEKDAHVPPISLPVPHEFTRDLGPQLGERWRVLPGAPFTAASRRYAYFGSIGGKGGMLDWCDNEADLTHETRQEIRAFFGKNGPGQAIKSFVSVPLVLHVRATKEIGDDWEHWAEPDGTLGLLLGVLNIHSSREDMFKEAGLRLFLPLMEPFLTCPLQAVPT